MNPVPLPPQGETRSMERKNGESYTSRNISEFPPFGGERSEPITRMRIIPYDTENQSRNASCVPFRGRGPRSGEGMYEGKNDYDILILCLIAFRSGGRRLAVRTAMEHPIGALSRTPFPASRDFPSRGNEKICGTGYCVTYDTESQSRNADFISIARRAIHNPRPEGPSNLRTLRTF